MKKIRIAVVSPLFPIREEPYRGSFVHATVVELQKLADVKVYCPVARYPASLQPKSFQYRKPDLTYVPPGVQDVVYFEYRAIPVVSRPLNPFTVRRALGSYFRADKPDLVLAYWLFPEGYGAVMAAKDIGVPSVVGSRGSDLRAVGDRLSKYFTRRCVLEADKLLTVSEELKNQAIALGVPSGKIQTIINGCDTSIFHPADRAEARRELKLEQDAEVVLFVGHLIRTKGLRELLDATAELAPKRPRLKVIVVGEGNLAEELSGNAEKLGLASRFILVGSSGRKEVARWMAACNLLCLPSYSEGCPNVVLETLSSNRPVVATNVGGIPEVVNQDCGILVPPADSAALARALDSALDRDWDSKSISDFFQRGWDRVAQETFEVCRQLVSKGIAQSAANGD